MASGAAAVPLVEPEVERKEKEPPLEVLAPFVAEFVGTFLLVFTAGTSSVVNIGVLNPIPAACMLMVSIYALGPVSGGHLNPAVSLACFLGRPDANPLPKMVGYVAAQVAAGLLAGWLYGAVFDKAVTIGPHEGQYGWFQAGIVEVLYTAMIAFVVLNCAYSVRNNPTNDQNHFFALAIGFVVVAGGNAGGPVSGGVFNPAVTLGLDVTGKGQSGVQDGIVWRLVYVCYQLLGAVIAGILFNCCRYKELPAGRAGGQTLHLQVVAAYNLEGCTETYITARLGSQSASTGAAGDANPQWTSFNTFSFAVQGDVLELEVMSKNDTTGDSSLGLLSAPLEKLPQNEWIRMREKLPSGGEVEYDLRVSDDFQPSLTCRIISEFLGTFMLVFTVTLCVATKSTATAWAAGSALMCMIYSLGDVSGGHFNPAVTLGVVLSRRGKCDILPGIAYVYAQLVAGLLAGLLASNIHAAGPHARDGLGVAPGLKTDGSQYGWWPVFVAEFAFTFMLAFVVIAVATTRPVVPPGKELLTKTSFQFALSIGFSVIAGGFAIGTISGGSLNPAVSWGLSTAEVASSSIASKSPWYYCLWYSLFELAGGVLAAIVFFATHTHEYTL